MERLRDLAVAIVAALFTAWWIRAVLRDLADPKIGKDEMREPWD